MCCISPRGGVLLARAVTLSLLAPWLSGCLFTGPMWADANDPTADDPRIFGVLEPDASGEAGQAGAARLLIVRYSAGADEMYSSIPLTEDGCPIKPFGYDGTQRKPAAILDDLPVSQLNQLRNSRLRLHDEEWAKRLNANPRFRRMSWQTDGRTVEYDDSYDRSLRTRPSRDRPLPEMRVRAFRIGRPWTESERAAMPLPVGSLVEYPVDACVLLIPYAQPRPLGDRRAAQVRAALWTPVTLLGDAVGVPFIFVACYVFGQCP